MKNLHIVYKILSLMVLCFPSAELYAQSFYKQLGVKAGAQLTNNAEWNQLYSGGQYGYHVGVFYPMKVGSATLQQEVLFSREGFNMYMDVPGFGGSTFFFKLYYLEANTSAKFRLFKNFYAYPGLQLSVLLDSRGRSTDPSLGQVSYNNPNRLDVGLMAGFNYKLTDKLALDLRCTRSVLRADRYTPGNLVLALGAEYKF